MHFGVVAMEKWALGSPSIMIGQLTLYIYIYIYNEIDGEVEMNRYIYIYIYTIYLSIYIYIVSKVKLATVVEGDPKAPFSIATTPWCMGGRYSFPRLLHFTLDPYLIMLSVKQGGIKYHFF